MKIINKTTHTSALWVLSLWTILSFGITVLAGPLDISDVPLELTPAVAPNILIVSDDSESMDWEVLTQDIINGGVFFSAHLDGTDDVVHQIAQRLDDGDGAADGNATNSCFNYAIQRAGSGGSGDYVDGYTYIVAFPTNQTVPIDSTILPNDAIIKNCYVADDEAWRARSYAFNKLYFDPNKTYVPWAGVDINGNPYANADIQNAPDDPYDPQHFIDLTLHKSGLALDGVSRIAGDGFAYYEWVDANNDGVAQNGEEPTKILINTAFQASAKTYPLSETEANDVVQNFANWFTYYRKREFVAKALISHSVANNSSARVGHATINQNSATSLRVKSLNQSLLTGNKKDLLDAIAATNSFGPTPLLRSYERAGEYFRCNASDIFNSSSSSNPGNVNCAYVAEPAGSCQVSSSFLLTDGFAGGAGATIVTSNEDSGGDTNTDFDGGAFADGVTNTLADIAMFYYEDDLQNTLIDDVPVTSVDLVRDPNSTSVLQAEDRLHQHLNTNVVGIFNPVGINAVETFPSDATTSFSWQPPGSFLGRVDDLKHAAYNGRGDFFSALSNRDFPELINSIDSTFSTAATTPGSTTSIAFNTQSIAQDSVAFRTFSNLATNSGDLAAQEVNVDGTLKTDVNGKPIFIWSAAEELPVQSSRLILTYDDSSTPSGKLFLSGPSNGLTAIQETALADPSDPTNLTASDIVDRRVDYLRGDSTNEGVNFDAGEMRIRAPIVENADGINTGGKIGDIVHSSPVFVGEPPFANRFGGAYPSTVGNTYFEYVIANSSREELVFVGANDGMLHAFQAADGVEKFAYIPKILLSEVPEYTKPEYSHQFYVDATPSINDVFIDPRPVSGSSREWRTVLVNGLGAGGKGYFALDITDPTDIDTDSVMWEFTASDDDNLGFTYSRPVIGMSNSASSGEQRWVAIFGNGFNNESSSGNASIYILFLDAGYNGWSSGDFIEIDTGIGKSTSADGTTPNGIGGVTGIDTDGNGTVDRLYAGDLQGNVYVFDISSTNTGSWSLEKTLFQANYTDAIPEIPQPITTRPTVVANPVGGYVVIIGTGSYFTNGDSTSTDIQSIYGLWDNPTNPTPIIHTGLSSQLVEQEFTTSITTVGGNDIEVRTVSSNDVTYNDNISDAITDVRGWYIDFDIAAPNSSAIQFPGERPVRNLQLRNNQLFFSTVIPQDGTSCEPSAGGFGLSVNPLDGRAETDVIFDINIDGVFDLNDNILISSVSTIVAGTRFKSAPSDSTFIGDYRVTQLSDTSIDSILVNPDLNGGGGLGALLGRHSWKEIRQ